MGDLAGLGRSAPSRLDAADGFGVGGEPGRHPGAEGLAGGPRCHRGLSGCDRVGQRVGSAALVADGLHARTAGLTSLGVLLGAVGVALGFQAADPIVGLLITVAIVFVLKDAARSIYRRLMDAVDPELVERARSV